MLYQVSVAFDEEFFIVITPNLIDNSVAALFVSSKNSLKSLSATCVLMNLPCSSYGSGGFFPYGLTGTLAGVSLCYRHFLGFESIAAIGEEAKTPRISIPISIGASLTLLILVRI